MNGSTLVPDSPTPRLPAIAQPRSHLRGQMTCPAMSPWADIDTGAMAFGLLETMSDVFPFLFIILRWPVYCHSPCLVSALLAC